MKITNEELIRLRDWHLEQARSFKNPSPIYQRIALKWFNEHMASADAFNAVIEERQAMQLQGLVTQETFVHWQQRAIKAEEAIDTFKDAFNEFMRFKE